MPSNDMKWITNRHAILRCSLCGESVYAIHPTTYKCAKCNVDEATRERDKVDMPIILSNFIKMEAERNDLRLRGFREQI